MTSKEAFKRLKFIADKELNTGSKSYKDLQEFWNYKEPLKVIEYLVERDTPMKVIKTPDWYYHCPKCKYKIDVSNVDYDSKQIYRYCYHCGQRLDWSKK